MIEILGSKTKTAILLYLGLRGGSSGRRLASVLRISPTQVFKALRQFVRGGIVRTHQKPFLYELNPEYPYHEEILSIIQKAIPRFRRQIRNYLPLPEDERKVDPVSVYELLSLRKGQNLGEKLSDRLRAIYG